MKIFMVIYVGSLIGGSIGPLPYDMVECRRRLEDVVKDAMGAVEQKHKITFACELHDARPKGDPSLGPTFEAYREGGAKP